MDSTRPDCPQCGESDVAEILYGLPDDTEELSRELQARRVILGACVIDDGDPQWHCNACGFEWRSDA